MYFRGLRGFRGVEDKDQPNFSLSLEDTANQLRGCVYIYVYVYIYIYIYVCVCVYIYIYTHTHTHTHTHTYIYDMAAHEVP